MNHATHSQRVPARPSRRAPRHGERGLTLVELLVAVVVGSILVGFVFDIQSRMSSAFRGQSNIGSLQQGIRAANELLARDIRQAGFMMPSGAFVSSSFNPLTVPVVRNEAGNLVVSGLTVFNNPDGRANEQMQPDRVHTFYADPDPTRHSIVVGDVSATAVGVDDASIFQPDELLLFTRQDPTPHPHPLGGNLPNVTTYFACVVQVTDNSGTTPSGFNEIRFDAAGAPYNTATNDHCFVPSKTAVADPAGNIKTQVFRLVARAYRIDTTNPAVAPLEVDVTGGLRDTWAVIGIGFVDLQITQRLVEEVSDLSDPDGDGNARMDWYSGGGPFPANSHVTQVGVGLVARTTRNVEGVRAITVPVLSDPAFLANNPLGDSGGPKIRTNPEFNGDYLYRQSSLVVDMRNIGVAF